MVRHSDSDSRSDDDDGDDDDDRLEWSSNGFDGDSSLASEASSQVAVDDGLPMSPDQAAAVIQGWVCCVPFGSKDIVACTMSCVSFVEEGKVGRQFF